MLLALANSTDPVLCEIYRQYRANEYFFSKEFLSRIQASGPSRIDLTPDQLQQTLAAGITEPAATLDRALRMHIFCLPEIAKKRWRIIIWTIDVNEYGVEIITIAFTSIAALIDDHLNNTPYTFVADSAAAYNQFPLREEVRDYFAFASSIGPLRLKTIATGQRHCVAKAELFARAIMRITVLSTLRGITVKDHTSGKVLCHMASGITEQQCATDTYIDNFKAASQDNLIVQLMALNFAKVCTHFGVTLNETSIIVSKSFEFRGIRFYEVDNSLHCHVTEKTVRKAQNAIADLQKDDWTFADAESAFGVCVYASLVLRLATHRYYYVYKYFRRMHRKITLFNEDRHAPARVWPCIKALWTAWLNEIANHSGRCKPGASPEYVVITDASKIGGGVLIFKEGVRCVSYGFRWSAKQSDLHINILEALAVKTAVEYLPPGSKCHIVIDNTSVIGGLMKRRSRAFHLNNIVGEVTQRVNVLSVSYVESAANPADGFSRGATTYAPQLAVDILNRINREGVEQRSPSEAINHFHTCE
jgi:hypothetical protein